MRRESIAYSTDGSSGVEVNLEGEAKGGRELTPAEKKVCCAEIKILNDKREEFVGFFADISEGMDIEAFAAKHNSELGQIKNYLINLDSFFNTVVDSYVFNHYRHDLAGMVKRSIENLGNLIMDFEDNIYDPNTKKNLTNLKESWDFMLLRIWDAFLRGVSKDKVPPEHRGAIDIGFLEGGLSYFEHWFRAQHSGEFLTKNGEERKCTIKLPDPSEWEAIRIKLDSEGKYVYGNTASLGNLEMNKIGNSLKSRIDATEVKFSLSIDNNDATGEYLVMVVEDDGRGMERAHLNPKDPDNFILLYGHSSMESTGLGLADAHTRLASCKNLLRIASKRRLEKLGETAEVVRYENAPLSQALEFPVGKPCGTRIEVRLPILLKQAA